MKWLAICLALAVCALCGVFGLVVGINLNPSSTVRFVPNLGSLGDWVSGLGAMAALGFAMWQFYFQRSKDRIFTSLVEKVAEKLWRVRVVSEGLIPVTVLGAEVQLKSVVLSLPDFFKDKAGFSVPSKLERGDVQQVIDLDAGNFEKFSSWFMDSVFEAVKQQGLQPRDMSYGVNEAYFMAVDTLISDGATLVVKLAHDEVCQPLPAYILEQLSRPQIRQVRDQALEDGKRKLKDDQEFFKELHQTDK